MPSLLSAELPLDDLPQFLLHIHRLCRGGAAPLARIIPSSSFVCDGLLRARRPALTGPSGGGLGIASVRSLYGQPAAGYLRFAPVARPTRDAHLLHGLPTPGLRWLGGAWSWGQVTPGYSRRTTLWFEGGRCDRPQGSHKNDTSGVEPVERPSHAPPRGTRGDPLGWSSPPPRVVNRSLQGGESEPPGTRAGASGCQAGPSSILVAAESRPFAAPGCARPPQRYLAAALSCSRPPRSIDAPAPSSGTAP